MRNFLGPFLCSLILVVSAHATIISPSAKEISYSYEAEFRTLKQERLNKKEVQEQAHFHAEHIFGIFHSPEYAGKFRIPSDLNDGYAGSTHPEVISAESFRVNGDPYLWVKYKAQGNAMVHQEVLSGWLGSKKSGTVSLPLLQNLPLVYSDDQESFSHSKWKKCTDSHYNTPIDFSYFYNPFLCEELSSAPIAADIEFKIELSAERQNKNTKVPLREIHDSNGNGKLVTLYFVFGFNEDPAAGTDPAKIHRDFGWKLYNNMGKELVKKYGFTAVQSESDLLRQLGDESKNIDLLSPVSLESDTQRRYFSTFVKVDGDRIYVARLGLFSTAAEDSARPLKSFPTFWKESWENGDFIYYGGHSGDGVSLSMKNLLNIYSKIDLEKINFKRNKTQIAFIDACSSFAHYKDLYSSKNKKGLHLITQGLVSLFHLAKPTLETIMPVLLEDQNIRWQDLLADVEKNSLLPHVQYLWGKEEGQRLYRKYAKKGLVPSSLINVWVP